VKLIQLDISPEELGNIVKADVPLYGSCDLIIEQFNDLLAKEPWKFEQKEWWTILNNKVGFMLLKKSFY
jgi:thiamine pyrophosphate-dependent acetolactate synthase large subunit-like protein